MGYCVPFALFSLGHPWPVLLPLGFLIPFTNSAFPWAITNFIGLPWPNYFILILGVHGLAINPLLSLFALLLGLQWPILTFLHHILPMGMLFLSFRASLSPFTSSGPTCLFYEPMIHHSCRLGLMALPLVCQTSTALVVGLFAFQLDPQKWPSTMTKIHPKPKNWTKYPLNLKMTNIPPKPKKDQYPQNLKKINTLET